MTELEYLDSINTQLEGLVYLHTQTNAFILFAFGVCGALLVLLILWRALKIFL